jgi:hypothetical protein
MEMMTEMATEVMTEMVIEAMTEMATAMTALNGSV